MLEMRKALNFPLSQKASILSHYLTAINQNYLAFKLLMSSVLLDFILFFMFLKHKPCSANYLAYKKTIPTISIRFLRERTLNPIIFFYYLINFCFLFFLSEYYLALIHLVFFSGCDFPYKKKKERKKIFDNFSSTSRESHFRNFYFFFLFLSVYQQKKESVYLGNA
jgi:hypothetical protein